MKKQEAATVINITRIKAACKDCSLHELCLPMGLGEPDLVMLDNAVKRRRTLRKGEMLYRFGDPLKSLYAIRSGSMKTTGLIEDGRVQITGFYLPGELLGIDAINDDVHPCSAEALEVSDVCEIPYPALEDLALKIPGLQHQLLRIMSREIVRDEEMLMLLGRMTAEEKLASCLMSFSRRLTSSGNSTADFKLSMSRQDLGDYLGLALETVSRLLSRFQEDGLITVHGRHILLHDVPRLRAMATGGRSEHSVRA